MGKRQRQTRKHCNRHGNRMAATEDRNQLIDAAEMKQEPDIKEEPQPIGDLATVPAQPLDNRGDEQELVDQMESDDEEKHADCLSDNDVKIEVKAECDENEKKEKVDEPESKIADEGESNDQQEEHQPDAGANNPQPNQIGTDACNVKKQNQTKVKGSTSKQHQCTQCEYVATCKSQLEIHLLKHTGEKPFACKHCVKAFKSKQGLQLHMKVHVKDFLFNCSVCLRGFDRKNVKAEHGGKCKALRYECHLCKTSFGSTKNDLVRHMLVHSGERAFECKECSKQFTIKSNLNKHMKLHAGPRPFHCSKCFQAFAQQNERNEHESNCNRRTFECYACGKAFRSNKCNLDQHMRTHIGDKPFECTKCSKKFAHKRSLNDHQKIHSQSLPWKCTICHQGFSKPTQCKAHQHSCQRRGYECHLCKKFFGSSLLNLKRHILTHTGEKPFKCEICQIRFTEKGNLRRHMRNIHNNKL